MMPDGPDVPKSKAESNSRNTGNTTTNKGDTAVDPHAEGTKLGHYILGIRHLLLKLTFD